MTTYNFVVLDLRPTPEAKALTEEIFNAGPVFGIEVTVAALAARCVKNLDPQHAGQDSDTAAIEAAWNCELPPAGATLATIRADADSIGAMVILELRRQAGEADDDAFMTDEVMKRVELIAAGDKSAGRGEWASKPLPQVGEALEATPERTALHGLARLIGDFKSPLAERIALMESYLLTGSCTGLQESVGLLQKERDEAILASKASLDPESQAIAVVQSTHRGAMGLGYCLAPVVVALNPSFKQGPGEPVRKFTVAQFSTGFIDLSAVQKALNEKESGWGGSPTIIGSPQGVSSKLDLQQVVGAVRHYLLK